MSSGSETSEMPVDSAALMARITEPFPVTIRHVT
jgi:hypothetical protein